MITGSLRPKQKPLERPKQSVSAMVQTFVEGLHPGSFEGMLKAIKFVVPIGGGFAFDALTAWRSVQPAPHVDPPVSAVDVTVNVMAGVAVGVGVGVTSGEFVTVSLTPRPWLAAADRFVFDMISKPEASRSEEIAIKTIASDVRRAKARVGLFFFIVLAGWG
jgi:hypothetical protein